MPELERLGLVSRIDRGLLAAYCDTWSVFVMASKEIAEAGSVTIEGRNRGGGVVRHPAVQVRRDAATALVQLARELGLSHRARQSLEVAHDWEDPAITDLLD
jgi:P27 family predicted phage terminase small subunit